MNSGIKALISGDMRTLKNPKQASDTGQPSNGALPLLWYHEFDGGGVFSTCLGHKIEQHLGPVFRQHLLGGIRWVMGHTATPPDPISL